MKRKLAALGLVLGLFVLMGQTCLSGNGTVTPGVYFPSANGTISPGMNSGPMSGLIRPGSSSSGGTIYPGMISPMGGMMGY